MPTPDWCLGASVGWHGPEPPLDTFKDMSAEVAKSWGPDHSWHLVTGRDASLEKGKEERWGTGLLWL